MLTTGSRHGEVALVCAARDGDQRRRDRIVSDQLGLVRAVAGRYRDLGLPVDDLVQEGVLGLLDAIATFDPGRGIDFETYARFRVRRAIRNALTEQSRMIRLPKQIVERRRAIVRAECTLAAAVGRVPTVAELAAATGLSTAAVVEAQEAAGPPVSLDQPLLDDGATLEDLLVDASAPDPAARAAEHERAECVDDAVAHLPERQREVVARHFGLGREAEKIGDVAVALHLSPQRARTIERDALYRLRDRLERRLGRRR